MEYSFKKTALFFLFFLFSISALFHVDKHRYNLVTNKELEEIHRKLEVLSPEEKGDLAYFINFAITFCEYPYTLVGSKPMSICDYLQFSEDLPQILREDYERPRHRKFADRLERGYQVYQKYSNLFPQNNYLISRYHASGSKGVLDVALIHRKMCLDVIQKNLDEFCEVFQKKCSAEEVFEILTHPNDEYFYDIVENHRLLGILLGFGKNNAVLFEQKRYDILKSFTNEWPAWPRKWRLPGFACDPKTTESQHLKKIYNETRKYIRWTYWNRDDLEVTLALLQK